MLRPWWRWRTRRLLDRARAQQAAGLTGSGQAATLRAALAAANRCGAGSPELARALDALVALAARDERLCSAPDLDGWIERRVALGADDLARASILSGHALTFRAARQPSRAEPLARRALGLLDASLPADDPRLEQALDTVAGIALRLGHHAEAEEALGRLLTLEERRADGLELAATLNRLAQVKRALGKNVEASDLDERVAELRERRGLR
ncbi:MAG: hypothetical protein IPK07_28520 [Deltaproteobacteria bacterium]|nr:hypothetical protein [Deltaproteobacteria bacterium]